MEQSLYNAEKEVEKITSVFDVHNKIPNLAEIVEILKYMTPIMRDKLVEYLSYYGLTLAQERLAVKDINDLKFINGSFTALFKLKTVFEGLQLTQPKKETS